VVGSSPLFIFTVVTAKKSAEYSGFPSKAAYLKLFSSGDHFH